MDKKDIIKKYQYLIGQKINKWTVLDIVYDRSKPDAICECECGTVKPVNLNNLRQNLTKDCGCGRKQMLRDTHSLNLVGQRFGKLTAVELLDESNKFKRRLYKCICDCGNEIIVPSSSLTTKHTSSCGCINSYYNAYIQDLLNRLNVDFTPEYPVVIDDVRYRFDFYLQDYNSFIEYDGEQHFMPVRFCGADKEKNELNFRKIQERDKIKNKYCEDNHIKLLRIPYYEKENIDSIIINYLQRLSEGGSSNNDDYATV